MTELRVRSRPIARLVRRKWFWAASLPLIVAGVCGWLTAPLEPGASPDATPRKAREHAPRPGLADWPATTLSGREAHVLLLASLVDARARLHAAGGYTALFRKTERISGKLGDEQVMEMKARLEPFAIYFKYRTPEPGKEVVFARGRYDDNLIAHGTGFSRALIPRLKVPPDSAIAMSGNRHPITDAGLGNLTTKLIGFRRMDLDDPDAVTILDRFRDDSGRPWLRSIHTHANPKSERPFQRVEVLYEPDTRIPVTIRSYDWAAPGETGDLKLAEQYVYEDLKLGVPLSDLDFDPANPSYDFSRF